MQSPSIHVSVGRQMLTLRDGESEIHYPVSTSRFGIGTEPGSFKTPPGRLQVSKKIGHEAPLGAVFKARVLTGEVGDSSDPGDLILTRILWLHGLEAGNANTFSRYIYIHGTNHEEDIGIPSSHGCIRMRNADIVELFDKVPEGAEVFIQP